MSLVEILVLAALYLFCVAIFALCAVRVYLWIDRK